MSVGRWWLLTIACCGILLLTGLRIGNLDLLTIVILAAGAIAALSAPGGRLHPSGRFTAQITMHLPRYAILLFWVLTATRTPARAQANPLHENLPPSTVPEIGTALWRGMPVHYVIRNGLPIYQGDIILDHLVSGPDPTNQPGLRKYDFGKAVGLDVLPAATPKSLGNLYPFLWPAVGGIYQIPYIVTRGSASLDTAIADYNATFAGLIQWVPRTAEKDYVNFEVSPNSVYGGGSSAYGRAGGEQSITCGDNCGPSTFFHEMGHATGLFHEQSRPDRDAYITLDYNHIRADYLPGDIATDAWIYGPYDYASIMEYLAFNLTADGVQTFQSIPAGIRLGHGAMSANDAAQPAGYSTGDIDTIRRLYGAAPTYVTIDTNPTGLQVIVDGATITTPQTYTNWAMNSTHTLDIPAGLSFSGLQYQPDAPSQGEFYYQFARWNDGGAARHTITITPGNGLLGYPRTSPAQTVYTANFIQWAPFTPSANGSYPPGTTLTTTPAPTNFAGVGQFFTGEQNVTLNANANAGYNFVRWFGYNYCDQSCPPTFYANPMNLRIFATRDFGAYFTTSQVTTITTNPPGLMLQVDGTTYASPARFSPDPNISGSAWASGTTHTISATSPQNPWSPNTTYVWSNWSDGQAQSHQITVPSGSSTITANYNTELGLVLTTNSSGNCAGSVTANPLGPFNAGTPVTFTATPGPGFVFTQWESALSGSSNPSSGPVNHEEFVQADFNIISSPLMITSFSPASVSAGGAPFTLTINGTGFIPPPIAGGPGSFVDVWNNGSYISRPVTYVTPTQLQIPILAADIANPGGVQIIINNFNRTGCWVAFAAHLPVSPVNTTPSPVLLKVGVGHSGNFTQGQNGATYSLTVSNTTGASPTKGTVTVAETVPSGLTLVSMTGTGWTCNANTCTRSDVLNAGASYPEITVTVNVASNAPAQVTNQVSVSGGGSAADNNSDPTTIAGIPAITPGGIVPISSTVSTIQPGEWVSIYGTNLASSTVNWTGNFPTSLGGTSVMIDGNSAYLSYVSPTQINLQVPDDASTGLVPVVVTAASGTSTSMVTLGQFAPSFFLQPDGKHVSGIIAKSDGSYDTIGPTGNSLGYTTVAAKAGDSLELFAGGLGPTSPAVPAGQPFSGAASTVNPVNLLINNVSVTPPSLSFAGLSEAGVYQINLTVPAGLGTGDVSIMATVGGVQTQSGVVISLQ